MPYNLLFCKMSILLFLFYISIFILLLNFLHAGKRISLELKWSIPAFLLKVLLGCAYGYIFLHYYGGDDTWMYYRQSLAETAFLKEHPLQFLHSLVDPTAYTRYIMNTYWQELEYASLIKLLGIFNLFSGSDYYVNVVLFSMVSFWGSYGYYKLFSELEPAYRKSFMLVFFFFVPLVFWTSGIRKDGLILLFTAMVFIYFRRFMQYRTVKYLIVTAASLFLLALQRNVVAILAVPVLGAWALTYFTPRKPWIMYLLVCFAGIVLFFLSPYAGIDLPGFIIRRQAEFLSLKGGSYIELDKLEPGIASFLHLLPQALNHAFLRPYPGEGHGMLSLLSSLETWFVVFCFIILLAFPKKPLRFINEPTVLSLVVFAFLNYLVIGYTIPFTGAIVRYRIVFEGILLASFFLHTDWGRLRRFIYK